ncbi:N-acetyltransferase family protein [Pseudovibrio ascidiaceicola]|uniref:GNAT family N-acetyltransferase n=1 Tax=Pseudovibrio ascidiaceicola TaxID=285279 RepID=UPI003D35B5C7
MELTQQPSLAINIRPAKATEVDLLAAIGLDAWRKGIKPLLPAFCAEDVETNNPFQPFVHAYIEHILVAQLGDNIAGFAAREFNDNRITDLWVHSLFEGKGIATTLLIALEAEIQNAGYTTALITVTAQNTRAHQLYTHLDYKVIRKETRYDRVLKTSLEKVDLRKKL